MVADEMSGSLRDFSLIRVNVADNFAAVGPEATRFSLHRHRQRGNVAIARIDAGFNRR